MIFFPFFPGLSEFRGILFIFHQPISSGFQELPLLGVDSRN